MPFKEVRQNRLEVFNELTILACALHLILFTEFLQDPLIRYDAGWSIIIIVLLNLAVNFAFIFKDSYHQFRVLLKKLCPKKT